jgi:FG-GAP repeat
MKSTLLSSLLMLCLGLQAYAYPRFTTVNAPSSIETTLTAPDADPGDEFGRAVAVQNHIAVVGAPNDATAGYGTGAAYVFEKTSSGWQFQQKLTAHDSSSYSFFGASVAVDGDRIVVGAYGDQNAGIYAGAAYVFVRVGSTWTPEAKLTGSENSTFDGFGVSVAIKGDKIVCGAFGNSDFNQSDVGSAYVFQRIDGLWLQQQELTAGDGASLARFGLSVAMSEDTIVVGADGDPELGLFSGAVYVFTFGGSNWVQGQKLHAQDAREGASFGYHVAISGDTIVAGAPGDEVGTHTHGAAYVFSRRSHGWLQDRKLIAKDKDVFDGFGLRVAVSEDTIVVGSVFDIEAALYAGAAYVYKRNGHSGWSLQEKLFASDAARDDAFGCAVAASNDTVLVGAFGRSVYAGAAYLYEF